jgi:DNA-binding transcriptional ArsR family regulator
VALLDDPGRLLAGLSPMRARLLDALAEPASATELAARLALTRQKVNYHLRVLESAGLVELVEVRQRRGCTERVMRRSAAAFVVDPAVLPDATDSPVRSRDRHATEHLIATASDTVRQVARMQTAADAQGQRLLTFTLETEVAFAHPSDVHAYADALAAAMADVAQRFHDPAGRRYRVVAGGHPAPKPPKPPKRRPADTTEEPS